MELLYFGARMSHQSFGTSGRKLRGVVRTPSDTRRTACQSHRATVLANTEAHGKSWLFFHGTDGRLLGQEIAGQGTLGERFYRLQLPIHGGRIIGLTGQVMIAVLGVLIAVLSGTGIYIWWRKLLARRSSKARKTVPN